MLISVQGNLIDTEKIYQISPVIGDNCWGHLYSYEDCEPKLKHSGFYFDIDFFNDKSLRIHLTGDDVYHDILWYENRTTYQYRINEVERQLNLFRDQVAEYWNKYKTIIPILELPKF